MSTRHLLSCSILVLSGAAFAQEGQRLSRQIEFGQGVPEVQSANTPASEAMEGWLAEFLAGLATELGFGDEPAVRCDAARCIMEVAGLEAADYPRFFDRLRQADQDSGRRLDRFRVPRRNDAAVAHVVLTLADVREDRAGELP